MATTSLRFFGRLFEKKKPNIPPFALTDNGMSFSKNNCFILINKLLAFFSKALYGLFLISNLISFEPAAMAKGFPDSVPA